MGPAQGAHTSYTRAHAHALAPALHARVSRVIRVYPRQPLGACLHALRRSAQVYYSQAHDRAPSGVIPLSAIASALLLPLLIGSRNSDSETLMQRSYIYIYTYTHIRISKQCSTNYEMCVYLHTIDI